MVDAGKLQLATSLVDAAVRAALASKAPRRTVAATGAAVASAVMAALQCGDSNRGTENAPSSASQRRRKNKKERQKAKSVKAVEADVDGDVVSANVAVDCVVDQAFSACNETRAKIIPSAKGSELDGCVEHDFDHDASKV